MRKADDVITGVTVVFNTKELIKRAYVSIRKFHPTMRIIIVDGSDTTEKGVACKKYTKSLEDSFTKVIHVNYNIGHGRGLVLGIQSVQTSFFLTFDSDIEMLKSPLQAMLNMMEDDTYAVGYTEKTDLGGHDFGARPEHAKEGSMRYLHPYFSLIQLKEYKKYLPFIHHGAPAVNTCLDIHRRGLSDKVIKEFPGLGHSAGKPINNAGNWKSAPREFIKHDRDGTKISIQGAWDRVIDPYKESKVTCITPTGDRPEAFALTRKWIQSQTRQPDQWIVVDDGKIPLPEELRQGLEYVRREPRKNEGHTLILNMKTALPLIKGDMILIIEDDDWYGPNYISTMVKHLLNHNLVGESHARYYHVPNQKFKRLENTVHASFCQTGFTKNLLSIFEQCLKGDPYIDMRLWSAGRQHGFLFSDTEDKLQLHCSLKGLKGRPGIGSGHNKNSSYYETDENYSQLIKWVGEENAKIYIDHVKGMRDSSEGITVITCTGDRPEAFNLLRLWMKNQIRQPDQWIVVDDGKTPLSNIDGFEYVRREPTNKDYTHTLCLNMLEAIERIRYEKIVIMEDDDWYSPIYIDFMEKQLEEMDLVGFGNLIFYYPSTGKYMEKTNLKTPVFAQTAFRRKVIPFIRKICEGASKDYALCGKGLIDTKLWKMELSSSEKMQSVRLTSDLKTASGKIISAGTILRPPISGGLLRRAERKIGAEIIQEIVSCEVKKSIVQCENYLSVGMKGMPGRAGTTSHQNANNSRYKKDEGFIRLKSILKQDAEKYTKFFLDN